MAETLAETFGLGMYGLEVGVRNHTLLRITIIGILPTVPYVCYLCYQYHHVWLWGPHAVIPRGFSVLPLPLGSKVLNKDQVWYVGMSVCTQYSRTLLYSSIAYRMMGILCTYTKGGYEFDGLCTPLIDPSRSIWLHLSQNRQSWIVNRES